jgi:hypothetical protein
MPVVPFCFSGIAAAGLGVRSPSTTDMHSSRFLSALAAVVALALVPAHGGFDRLPVRGTLSLTSSYSDKYDYLGDTGGQVALNQIDLILNSSHRFENGLRVGAQLYAYRIGGFNDLTLDFANADYRFHTAFGLRVGRNKLPLGLYNDAQDLDQIRVFASLPIAFYPKTLRAITSSFDGALAYGAFDFGRAGGLEYQVFGGFKESISGDTPFVRGISNLTRTQRWEVPGGVYGGSFFYQTPIDGLRVGYSFARFPENDLPGVLNTSSEMGGSALNIVGLVNQFMGPGAWDKSGLFAGTPATTTGADVLFRIAAAEYTVGDWSFAAEYKLLDIKDGVSHVPAFALIGQPATTPFASQSVYYYGMASWQAKSWLGLGSYYSYSRSGRNNPASRRNPGSISHDYAVAATVGLTNWWLVKLEYHFIDGTNFVNGAGDNNRTTSSAKWNYVVFKTTVSF